MPVPLIGSLGPSEMIIIFLIVLLLFGAAKLPDLARNSGRALRIFKAETKGLMDGDKKDDAATSSEAEQRDTERPPSND